MISRKLSLACIIALGLLVPTLSFAAFPAGQWTASYYSEVGFGNGSQGICIVDDGTWYGTTFSGWSGKWFRKSNDIHLQGNSNSGAASDALELTRISPILLTGYWQNWINSGSSNNWLTVRVNFVGATCDPPAAIPSQQAASTALPSDGQ